MSNPEKPNVECLECGWTFFGTSEKQVRAAADEHEALEHNGKNIRWEWVQ